MSTSADVQSMEKELVVINGKPQIDEESSAMETECDPQCSVVENSPPEPAQTESLSDWFVMICVLLCNLLNGIHFASYGVLYLPITEMFQSSRAAVGWIISFDLALASFLGELHMQFRFSLGCVLILISESFCTVCLLCIAISSL